MEFSQSLSKVPAGGVFIWQKPNIMFWKYIEIIWIPAVPAVFRHTGFRAAVSLVNGGSGGLSSIVILL
jgi:hypothetical protein